MGVKQEKLGPEYLARSAEILNKHFIQRHDLYATQLIDGRYICNHQALTDDYIFDHLRGTITLGTYLLDRESRARFVVLDADAQNGWSDLLGLAARLAHDNVPAYLEKSRRGGHLWMFFGKAVPGLDARNFARGILEKHNLTGIEIYPKQDTIGKGPGSLVRLPFGIHRLTSRRYGFYTHTGEPLAKTLIEQIYALESPEVVSDGSFLAYKSVSLPLAPEARPDVLSGPTDVVSKRIKAQITALEFISRYVDLKQIASGGIGLCPFHADERPSFGVHDKGNYWHCFSGCGGGSIIDFWAKWREKRGDEADFIPTITELADILL